MLTGKPGCLCIAEHGIAATITLERPYKAILSTVVENFRLEECSRSVIIFMSLAAAKRIAVLPPSKIVSLTPSSSFMAARTPFD